MYISLNPKALKPIIYKEPLEQWHLERMVLLFHFLPFLGLLLHVDGKVHKRKKVEIKYEYLPQVYKASKQKVDQTTQQGNIKNSNTTGLQGSQNCHLHQATAPIKRFSKWQNNICQRGTTSNPISPGGGGSSIWGYLTAGIVATTVAANIVNNANENNNNNNNNNNQDNTNSNNMNIGNSVNNNMNMNLLIPGRRAFTADQDIQTTSNNQLKVMIRQ